MPKRIVRPKSPKVLAENSGHIRLYIGRCVGMDWLLHKFLAVAVR
jgi:hypothetical protein